jgi:hypothetical protein
MGRYSPQDANEILAENPSMPPELKAYWEAVIDGTLGRYYLGRLINLRDDYSDEIPDVPAGDLAKLGEGGQFVDAARYKCRGKYIVGLTMLLQNSMLDGVVADTSLTGRIEKFCAYSFSCFDSGPTTRQEISMINGMLKEVISYLRPRI